jgi:hypothetical protein
MCPYAPFHAPQNRRMASPPDDQGGQAEQGYRGGRALVSMPAKCSIWLMPGMDHTPRDGGAVSGRSGHTLQHLVGQLRSGMLDLAVACAENIAVVGRQGRAAW